MGKDILFKKALNAMNHDNLQLNSHLDTLIFMMQDNLYKILSINIIEITIFRMEISDL